MTMRIAVPIAGTTLCSHFGQCESFVLFDIDDDATIAGRCEVTPPDHAPGVYPAWLAQQRVSLVLAGGMGGKARELFAANNIQVVVGVEAGDPESVVTTYLAGRLVTGENACVHGPAHTCDH